MAKAERITDTAKYIGRTIGKTTGFVGLTESFKVLSPETLEKNRIMEEYYMWPWRFILPMTTEVVVKRMAGKERDRHIKAVVSNVALGASFLADAATYFASFSLGMTGNYGAAGILKGSYNLTAGIVPERIINSLGERMFYSQAELEARNKKINTKFSSNSR